MININQLWILDFMKLQLLNAYLSATKLNTWIMRTSINVMYYKTMWWKKHNLWSFSYFCKNSYNIKRAQRSFNINFHDFKYIFLCTYKLDAHNTCYIFMKQPTSSWGAKHTFQDLQMGKKKATSIHLLKRDVCCLIGMMW
jgi:hypothetical protein